MNDSIFLELFSDRYAELIPHFDNFLRALERPRPTGLRLNTSLCSRDSFISRFNLKAGDYHLPLKSLDYLEVGTDKSKWGGALEHHLGFYYVQALSSLLPVLALNPGEEDTVLDMCAAPGGKTTHLASLMNNRGVIVANEPHLGRRRILKASLSRLGVSNTIVSSSDGQDLNLPAGCFTKILLDGPCSSEGTLRVDSLKPSRKGDHSHLTYNKVFREGLHKVQRELLEHAYTLLAPGGVLVYSTCTYDPFENEAQVDHLLQQHRDMKLTSLGVSSEWDSSLSDGITEYGENSFNDSLTLTKRIYPHYLNSIGFYVSKLVKDK